MGDEPEALVDRAEQYRQLATSIRARAASMKSAAVRHELAALAADYEILAEYAQSLSPDLPGPAGVATE
jgi:hypothetical protein